MNVITDTFLSGTHALQCSSRGTLKRHNAVLKGLIAANLNKQGYNFNTERTILDGDGKKAGDAYVSNPYVDEPKTILDVTIVCPTCPTYICNAAAASNDHCTKLAEKNKPSGVCTKQTLILDCKKNSYECLPLRPNNDETPIEIHQGLSSQ